MPKLWLSVIGDGCALEADKAGKQLKKKFGKFGYGCQGCPLQKRRKLLGHDLIKKRPAMIWGISPTKADIVAGQYLSGRAGRFLWRHLSQAGLTREDFDMQTIVRCRPVSDVSGYMIEREPAKEEIAHCRAHTDTALRLNLGAAGTHIVFGQVAAAALFGREYKKDCPIFWSDKLSAKIFVLDPPEVVEALSEDGRKYKAWAQRLRAALWHVKNSGRYAWLDALPIRVIKRAATFEKVISEMRSSGERIAVDIEDAKIDGETKILVIGFSWAKNEAAVVVLDHPENTVSQEEISKVRRLLKQILEDETIEKIFHYGSYDTIHLQEALGVQVRGYTFDTTYAHYLANTFIRSHSLDTIATLHYPHYAGYKQIVQGFYSRAEGLAACPLPTLIKYNGADAALTKRIEVDNRDEVSAPLVRVYIGAGRTLFQMERRGPTLDMEHQAEAERIIPHKISELASKIRQLAGKPDLNPNAPTEIAWAMYDKLKLPTLPEVSSEFANEESPRSTKESTLSIIAQATGHPFPQYVLDYRKFSKMDSTYLRGYRESAGMHSGELRTKWYLTGAVTGRLRSGGTRDGIHGVVNMQNLHGSPFLKNLLVSDAKWCEVLFWEAGQELPEDILAIDLFLAFDYSQIEIRMLAECSGDPLLIEQFNAGLDIHCAVGNAINPAWSFEFIKKDKDTRTFIKNCHFGLIYGLSEKGLYYYLKAKGIKATEEQAARFHRDYFARYRGVASYIDRMRAKAERDGYVDTIFGFRRRIGNDYDEDRTTNPLNQAINSPIQGAAHTLLLCSMAILDETPSLFPLLSTPIMEVHDALVFRVKFRDLPEAYVQAKTLLEGGVVDYTRRVFDLNLRVPLVSEGSAGFRYGVLEDYFGGSREEFLAGWLTANAATDAKMAKEFFV